MKIGVMGTGGVGGYFGGLLAGIGQDIHFVARGKHLQGLQEHGLEIVSRHGSHHVMVHATSEPDEIGPVDLVLFCVKSYDTESAAFSTEPMVEEDTVILSLQNGIDNLEKLVDHFGEERVMGGTSYIEASIASPGVIFHSGPPGRIQFGELDGGFSPRALAILNVLLKAGIEAELSDNIHQVLWEKFLFICGIHGVATISRAPLGLVMAFEETRELLTGVMQEVEALARRKGVGLPADALEQAVALADSYNRGFKCSMLRDLEWRRPMEIEALNGMVVRLGRELDVPTPLNQAIYAVMKLEDLKNTNPFWVKQTLGNLGRPETPQRMAVGAVQSN